MKQLRLSPSARLSIVEKEGERVQVSSRTCRGKKRVENGDYGTLPVALSQVSAIVAEDWPKPLSHMGNRPLSWSTKKEEKASVKKPEPRPFPPLPPPLS